MATTLVCPKCQGEMQSYERNGIQIEQCRDCRGIFLDRGELERLIDVESTYVQQAPSPVEQPGGYGHHGGGHGSKQGGRRRRGFLGELFD